MTRQYFMNYEKYRNGLVGVGWRIFEIKFKSIFNQNISKDVDEIVGDIERTENVIVHITSLNKL